MRVVFVHGACVQDGAWWWHRTAKVLELSGVQSVAPLLPSCGETGLDVGAGGAGFEEDVAAVREVLTSSDEPTVVVAHSYGGVVTAEAAASVAAVRSIVYVSSYLPEPGEALGTFAGSEPAPFLSVDPQAGTISARPEMFVDTFMFDCPGDLAAESLDFLAIQSASVAGHPVASAAWKAVPTTYVVCANDRGTPVDKQRQFAERATRVVELESGHHPFLSQPEAMAKIITDQL